MKNKLKLVAALIVVAVFTYFGVMLTNNSYAQNDGSFGKEFTRNLSNKKADNEATPIVSFDDFSRNSLNDERIRKNAEFDKQNIVKNDFSNSNAVEFSIYSSALRGLPNIPVSQSDFIFEGTVIDSKAYLSNDKSGIYSEFTVEIKDVLKNTSGVTANLQDSIVGERFGGRVSYSDGKVVRYGIVGQGSPVVGKTYYLFLKKTAHGSFQILTGYELRKDKVFALDGSHLLPDGKGAWSFDTNNDKDYLELKDEIKEAVNNPQNLSEGVIAP